MNLDKAWSWQYGSDNPELDVAEYNVVTEYIHRRKDQDHLPEYDYRSCRRRFQHTPE